MHPYITRTILAFIGAGSVLYAAMPETMLMSQLDLLPAKAFFMAMVAGASGFLTEKGVSK
jgi:hypothetical protein